MTRRKPDPVWVEMNEMVDKFDGRIAVFNNSYKQLRDEAKKIAVTDDSRRDFDELQSRLQHIRDVADLLSKQADKYNDIVERYSRFR